MTIGHGIGPKEKALREARERELVPVLRREAGRAQAKVLADAVREVTPAEYRALRERIGSQGAVAKLLGIRRQALILRERGRARVTQEMALALVALGGAKR